MTGFADHDRDEAAALWCLDLKQGTLAPDDQHAFESWYADEANAAAFHKQLGLWDLTDAAAGLPESIRLRTQSLETYRNANARRWSPGFGRGGWRGWAGGIAAIAAVLLLVILVRPAGDAMSLFSTGVGERRVAMLGDGSRLTLDADSAVEVLLRPDRRILKVVRGRAKFDVAKDPLRPFSVAAGDDIVVATGTSFSVERLDRAVSVILYEGHVAVLREGGSDRSHPDDRLRPGRQMWLAGHDAPRITPVAPARASSWASGRLDFDNELLATAVARINRYSHRNIVMGSDVSPMLRVTGVFDANDTDAFLEGVAAVNGLAIRKEPHQILLTRG